MCFFFFWQKSVGGWTLIGLFLEGTTPTCYKGKNFTKKKHWVICDPLDGWASSKWCWMNCTHQLHCPTVEYIFHVLVATHTYPSWIFTCYSRCYDESSCASLWIPHPAVPCQRQTFPLGNHHLEVGSPYPTTIQVDFVLVTHVCEAPSLLAVSWWTQCHFWVFWEDEKLVS
jgi:hypothetical protein